MERRGFVGSVGSRFVLPRKKGGRAGRDVKQCGRVAAPCSVRGERGGGGDERMTYDALGEDQGPDEWVWNVNG